jgi:hypothetical protein
MMPPENKFQKPNTKSQNKFGRIQRAQKEINEYPVLQSAVKVEL